MSKTLHAKTLALLQRRPEKMSLRVISEDTGLNVDWLRKFLYAGIDDPGVNKVERLHDYLVEHDAAA